MSQKAAVTPFSGRCRGGVGGHDTVGNGEARVVMGPNAESQEKPQCKKKTSLLHRSSEEQPNSFSPTDNTHSSNLPPELCDVQPKMIKKEFVVVNYFFS
ncbi:hypothetical protein WISP_36416 [Willisornis vidua]|uniref:Uncharacterized protein n=1 Tax=Willisornis vidua TaxID=1566151 RepID=A0ABQ9DPN8_9PASS|nr:hypothetical protein WISP_36416 [Willisornis vidua]